MNKCNFKIKGNNVAVVREEFTLRQMSTHHIGKVLKIFCFCFILSFLTNSSHFVLPLRLLMDTVVHFPPSLEEVTVSVSDERMWFRNHVEEEAGDFVVRFFSNQQLQTYFLKITTLCLFIQILQILH